MDWTVLFYAGMLGLAATGVIAWMAERAARPGRPWRGPTPSDDYDDGPLDSPSDGPHHHGHHHHGWTDSSSHHSHQQIVL